MKLKRSSTITIMGCGLKAKMIMLLIATLTIFGTGLVYAGSTTVDVTISVGLRDIWPPAPITNLSALAGIQEGEVRLSWTAPCEDDKFSSGAVQGYDIEYDTFSISDLGGDTTAWWSAAGGWKGITFANDPGETEQTTINYLWPGTTYYFAIKSYDDASPPNESPIDTRAESVTDQAYCVVPDTPPATPTGLIALGGAEKVDLSWNELTESEKGIDFDYYKIYRSSISPSILFAIDTTTSTVYSDTGLQPKTSYYYAISAVDKPPLLLESPLSEIATAWVISEDATSPAAVTDLVATPGAGYDRIDLSWTAPGDDGWLGMATKYIIKYATYNITAGNFDSITAVKIRNVTVSGGNPDSETITGLAKGTLYYFAIKTEDDVPNISGISNVPSAKTASLIPDAVSPRQPAGIEGTLSADRKTMTISWSGVSKNEDGTVCEDLSGYNIYRASVVDGEYTLVDSVAKGESLVWTDPENIEGRIYYYMVRAKDTSGNLSKISMIVDCSKDLDIIAVNSEEMSSCVVIPKEVREILYKENNSYGDDVIIEVLRNKEEESGRIIKSYNFIAQRGQNGKEIKDFVFAKPLARIVLTYEVENGHVKRALSVPEDRASEQLALFWFNGLEWIKLGGEVDEYFRLVSIKSKRIGKYMLKESFRASSFVIESIQPDKTFTPNGDGWNDYFEIKYANPRDGSVSGKIYDLRGALVAGMEKGTSDYTLKWDGKDANGSPAPGGVYIYQIEVTGPENKVINGTVVVAR